MPRVSKFERPRLQHDVPAVLEALGIQVVKRERHSLYALCPFHADTTPNSWSIVSDPNHDRNGFHYCFSCQNGGGIVALVAHVRDITTAEAYDWLGSDSLQKEAPLEIDVVVSSYSVGRPRGVRVPPEVKVRPLAEWPTPARRYLDERRITAEQVSRFDLGFAVEGRLAGRIVFPMKDLQGFVCSYTARDFTGQGKRYKEPQSDEGAVKGALFGEHLWSEASSLLIAEGCPDALALDQVSSGGDSDVCALHGSHLHPSQAVKFSRYKTIVVATDPDPAGDRVALDIEVALGRYCRVVRARPPEKQDCGSMDPEALHWLIRGALENG